VISKLCKTEENNACTVALSTIFIHNYVHYHLCFIIGKIKTPADVFRSDANSWSRAGSQTDNLGLHQNEPFK